MKKTIDKFVYLIVVAAVISGIYSIYVWSQRGEFELLIIEKGNPVMLLFMALTLVVHIMFFVELYNWYVSQQRLLSSIFVLVSSIGVFIYFLYTALKRRM